MNKAGQGEKTWETTRVSPTAPLCVMCVVPGRSPRFVGRRLRAPTTPRLHTPQDSTGAARLLASSGGGGLAPDDAFETAAQASERVGLYGPGRAELHRPVTSAGYRTEDGGLLRQQVRGSGRRGGQRVVEAMARSGGGGIDERRAGATDGDEGGRRAPWRRRSSLSAPRKPSSTRRRAAVWVHRACRRLLAAG